MLEQRMDSFVCPMSELWRRENISPPEQEACAVVTFQAHRFTRYGFRPLMASDAESQREWSAGRPDRIEDEVIIPKGIGGGRFGARMSGSIDHDGLSRNAGEGFLREHDVPPASGSHQPSAQFSDAYSEGVWHKKLNLAVRHKAFCVEDGMNVEMSVNPATDARCFRLPSRTAHKWAHTLTSTETRELKPNRDVRLWCLARSPDPPEASDTDSLDSSDLVHLREKRYNLLFALSGARRVGWGSSFRLAECALSSRVHVLVLRGVERTMTRPTLHPFPATSHVFHMRALGFHSASREFTQSKGRPHLKTALRARMLHEYCVGQAKLFEEFTSEDYNEFAVHRLVWRTSDVLFGNQSEIAGVGTPSARDGPLNRARLLCILKDHAARTLSPMSCLCPEDHSAIGAVQRTEDCEKILHNLIAFSTEEACAACASAGESRLAALVACAGIRSGARNLIKSQATALDADIDSRGVDAPLWRPIVRLLSGDVTRVAGFCDWRVALGLVAYYSMSTSARLSDIVLEYERLAAKVRFRLRHLRNLTLTELLKKIFFGYFWKCMFMRTKELFLRTQHLICYVLCCAVGTGQ